MIDYRLAALKAELYPFQKEGVDWLTQRRTAYLADEMGLGKSPQMILAADEVAAGRAVFARDCAVSPFIQVICPAIAVIDWYRKFHRWSAAGRNVYCSYSSQPVAAANVKPNSVIISGYETSIKFRKLLQNNPHRGGLFIDEAHYVKNAQAKRTRGLYGANCSGGMDSECISKHYDYVWLASGTPVPNGDPREMWPHVHALRPYSILNAYGVPMSFGEWRDEFCVLAPGLGLDKLVEVRNEPRFLRILNDFMLRRLGDVAGLPEVRFELYPMEPRNVPRELAIENWPALADRLHAILDAAGDGDLDSQLEEQLATVRRLTGLLKIQATVELIGEELRSGTLDKVALFAYHIDVVRGITERLRQFGANAIYGAINEQDRWKAIDAFNEGRSRVIVGQIQAASTNTSLGTCRHVFFAESDWVGNNNLQAAYRCRRIDGHRQPVLARVLSITGTIDELIQEAAVRKMRRTTKILPRHQEGHHAANAH